MRFRKSLVAGAIAAPMVLLTGCTGPVQQISFGTGSLGLEGASITLPLRVQCQTGWNIAFGDVIIAQANGQRLAQGFGSFVNDFPGVPCTGARQTVQVVVFNFSPWIFNEGGAAASGDVTVYNPDSTELVTKVADPREIAVIKTDPQPDPKKGATPVPDPRYWHK